MVNEIKVFNIRFSFLCFISRTILFRDPVAEGREGKKWRQNRTDQLVDTVAAVVAAAVTLLVSYSNAEQTKSISHSF